MRSCYASQKLLLRYRLPVDVFTSLQNFNYISCRVLTVRYSCNQSIKEKHKYCKNRVKTCLEKQKCNNRIPILFIHKKLSFFCPERFFL